MHKYIFYFKLLFFSIFFIKKYIDLIKIFFFFDLKLLKISIIKKIDLSFFLKKNFKGGEYV